MKIFHTADWHLGKIVQGVSMLEDQTYILQQLLEEIKKEKPDVLIVAGDLYDRSIPPTEAIYLLNTILKELIMDIKIPVLAIAGNHDSATRIHFGSDLMKHSGLHMVGDFTERFEPVILEDGAGPVHFYLVPFVEPSMARTIFKDETLTTHEAAMAKTIERIEETMDRTVRNVFIGHAFITKDGLPEENTSDSERRLTIGGTECINADLFEAFDYAAFGHLHQAHFVKNKKIQYAGSPLKYSESEVNHKKGYLVVDLQADGEVEVEKALLKPSRDMRIVTGSLDEILKQPKNEDYVFVKLTDEDYVKSATELVRTVYPNALHVERTAVMEMLQAEATTLNRVSLDDVELFDLFYKDMTGKEADESLTSLFGDVLQQILDDEREKQEVSQ